MQSINDQEFEKLVKSSSQPVLVDFYADWCGPCKSLSPKLEKVASEYQGKVEFKKMNVDFNPETASKFGVRSIPTVMIFKNGQLKNTFVGDQAVDRIKSFVDAALV